MARGTRGSAFKNKISGLERAKDQNPFASGGRGFSLPSNYKQTEAAAFKQAGADMSNYGNPNSGNSNLGNSKGFLDKFIGGMDSFYGGQKEKSDTDKLIDFAKSQQQAAQFGGGMQGLASEVAEGYNIYQPPSPNQQMFIPGQEGKGGFNPIGAVVGGIRGFKGGGPIGAIGGGLAGGFGI